MGERKNLNNLPKKDGNNLQRPQSTFVVDDFDANETFAENSNVVKQEKTLAAQMPQDFQQMKSEIEEIDETQKKSLNSDEKLQLGVNIAGLVICAIFAFIFLVLVM